MSPEEFCWVAGELVGVSPTLFWNVPWHVTGRCSVVVLVVALDMHSYTCTLHIMCPQHPYCGLRYCLSASWACSYFPNSSSWPSTSYFPNTSSWHSQVLTLIPRNMCISIIMIVLDVLYTYSCLVVQETREHLYSSPAQRRSCSWAFSHSFPVNNTDWLNIGEKFKSSLCHISMN